MYKENLKFSLRCPKHKGYNPRNGFGDIKGGCVSCVEIYNIFNWKCDLERIIREFRETYEKEN